MSNPGTIWSSLTLHRLPFNTLLMSLGIVCLFECLANLAASVVYLIAQVGYTSSLSTTLNITN